MPKPQPKKEGMRIVKDWPPNIEAIRATFNISNMPQIVYTYGTTIYNPGGGMLPPELIAHEETHSKQQLKMGVDMWWSVYLQDHRFRLAQELEAYRVQYQFMKKNGSTRSYRRQVLRYISRDLAGRMYGNMITKERAKQLITEGSE